METVITNSLLETQLFANNFAKKFSGGLIILSGELGSGKTSFAQGFAKGLKIKDKIISPTFVLIRQHQIPYKDAIFYHIDLYRLEGKEQFIQLGIKDFLENSKNIILAEWGEKFKDLLPNKTTIISIEIISENKRKITINHN